MNTKTYIGVIVALMLVHFQSAYADDKGLGGLGQRPRCSDVTNIAIVDLIANPILQTPCEIVTCLLDFRCEEECLSPLLTKVINIVKDAISSAVCDKGLVPCPDNLDVETCLGPKRKAIFGY